MVSTSTVIPHAATPLWILLAAEVRRTFGLRHLLMLACLILMGIVLAAWLPMFPESVLRFFQRVFALPAWPEIVFANALAAIFFFIYWLAVFDVLGIYVLPYEEGTLDLILSKPISRRTYVMARLAPIVAATILLGTMAAVACWAAMSAAGLSYPFGPFLGATAATLAWTVLLIAVVNLLILGVRDSFSAAAVAFVPMFLAILPSMVFMYRPDLLESAPGLKDVAVFPMNLVWFPDVAERHGWSIAAAMLSFGCLAAMFAGAVLEHRDTA